MIRSPRLQMQQGENHNHKPVFLNCSNYAPIVQEEELAGTVVIQVHAEDRDHPEEGGESRSGQVDDLLGPPRTRCTRGERFPRFSREL